MLCDFLLELVIDPLRLNQWKRNPGKFPEELNVSAEERDAIEKGDLKKLRMLLREQLLAGKEGQHFAADNSSYTVIVSGDTPHCPINPPTLATGAFDSSFWRVMAAAPTWDSEGLTVVGTGIRAGLQTTPESLLCIREAKNVLFLVADPFSQIWIHKLNPAAESMQLLYSKGKYRLEIYNAIVKKVLERLREKRELCVAFYGHPGMFVYPAHEAIRLARKEGFKARMLAGVSAEANLCSDLGIDPGVVGLQSYEATNFVLNRYRFDTSSGLLLWQVGLFGYARWDPEYKPNPSYLKVLMEYLGQHYPPEHEVILYEASELPLGNPTVQPLPLTALAEAQMSGVTSLYVPPRALPSADLELAKKLGIPLD